MTRLAFEVEIDDKYLLPRNDLERSRLQNQHELFTQVFDGRLIIDKNVSLKAGHRVLDSGTGAASWILDLLRTVPSGVDIIGIDISTAMFPACIPKNVSLHEMSFLNLPSSWDGSFDFANQRLLIAALTKEQWQTNLSGLFRILKPGGSIQITEVEHFGVEDESITLPATEICDAYCIAILEKRKLLGFDCWAHLPILLKEAGFANIHVEIKKVPLGKQWGRLGVMGAQNWDEVYRALGIACLEQVDLGVCKSREEVESVVEQAKREWDENPGIFIQAYALTARKPL